MLSTKTNFSILVLIVLINNSCIEEYIPKIGNQDTHKIFIYGQVTNVEGYQNVTISTSSPIANPKEIPLPGCTVTIQDSNGNFYNLAEYEAGQYRVWMSKEDLRPGTAYKLKVVTNTWEEIESDFDQMPECPKIDSIYFVRKDIPNPIPDTFNINIQGIQFLIDFDATGDFSRYYKWEIEETWEHHSALPIKTYWDGYKVVTVNDDYSKFVCWTTKKVPEFFTLSTENLAQQKVNKQSLHFVGNLSQRLTYCYSIKVSQYALSASSFTFWDQLKVNNDLGGMYGRQPINVKGNLRSVTFPEKKVLGVFQAVSLQTKRIFVRNIRYIRLNYPLCVLPTPRSPLVKFPLPNFRIYLYGENPYWRLDPTCVQCDYLEGTTIKPDFWPY